ncbi:MAG TPA: hypothetical protein VF819_03865 [Nitrospira sp.]
MICRRCQGCMARDHFLDLQESGGEWWMEGWRCINCGHVFDPVVEQNRRLHAAAMASAVVRAPQAQPVTVVGEQQELPLDIAA